MFACLCSQNAPRNDNTWSPELLAFGYDDALPAPSPAVQATLAGLDVREIHDYIQTQDRAALLDRDEDGMNAPLFLTTLDLSQWTLVLATELNKPGTGLDQLRKAHEQLAEMLDFEVEEIDIALHNSTVVDAALKRANPHEMPKAQVTSLSAGESSPSNMHPLLGRLLVAPAHKAALEDFSTAIQNTQTELDMSLLISSGKGPSVPFVPTRAIEEQLAFKGYRCWGLPNINLLAPISINMWKTWSHLTDGEMETLRNNAIYGTGVLKEAQLIPHNFPLALFDHQKCPLPTVRVHTKQHLQTGYGRDSKYTSALWNCQRPYLRCSCKHDAAVGCRGEVMWFDHAVFYMINHLGVFFQNDLFPTLPSKFAAFLVWMTEAARVAVRHQVMFAHTRELMCEAALEFAADPEAKLLAKYPDGQGIRNITRLIKPAGFSAANPSTPGAQNVAGKRSHRINCNVEPAASSEFHGSGGRRGTPSGTRGGRGGYNKRFRSNRTAPTNNEAFVYIGSNGKRSPATPRHELTASATPSPSNNRSITLHSSPNHVIVPRQSPSSITTSQTNTTHPTLRTARASMRGRALDWDNVKL